MKRSPVLLIGFNRPDNMSQVFAQIRKAKPDVLYIAVDGPRESKEGEEKKCEECRSFAKQVDWPCEVHTLFREKNVGCALGVSGAISWAFENEDRLIILEDDCVPDISFFSFCDNMLEMYKDDTRVWQVCGRSYHPNSSFFDKSDYIFSHYAHIWGWATWKRCWAHFDLYMKDFPEYIKQGGAYNVFQSQELAKYANRFNERVYNNIEYVSSHTWDYQWSYTKEKNGALGIVPRFNLIKNIGTESGAHANGAYVDTLPFSSMPNEIRHPLFVIDYSDYDEYHSRNHVNGTLMKNVFKTAKSLICNLLK